jgi:predicted enzyme related to lactoylglutathione lyase
LILRLELGVLRTTSRVPRNYAVEREKNVMTEISAEIVDIIIDCSDPEVVAGFWASLLGRPIVGRKGPYVWLQRPEGVAGLGFQRVREQKIGKNRVHLDVSAADIRALAYRIEALGGRKIHGYEEGGFLVMADPEGNEFCVVPPGPIDFDEQGRTHYQDDTET